MTDEITIIGYDASIWENTVFAMIRSRPYASASEIVRRADEITAAYRERFLQEDIGQPAQILPFTGGEA